MFLKRIPPAQARRYYLVLLVVVGSVFRLDGLGRDLVDHHSWRQCDTASIARNFIEEDSNPFHPRVDWRGGADGLVEWNFPVFPYLVSVLYRVVGIHVVVGRLLSVIFSLSALVFLVLLLRRFLPAPAPEVAGLLMAVNPLAVYFGRTFMPEAMLLASSLVFLWAIAEWNHSSKNKYLVWAWLSLTLAGLIKIPFGYLVVPAAVWLWQARGKRAFADPRLWGLGVTSLVCVGAWYVYAHRLGAASGLSFAPIWDVGADKWGSLGTIGSADFWTVMGQRMWRYIGTGPLILFILWGTIASAWGAGSSMALSWLGGGLLYVFLIARGHLAHTYYQIALVPIAATLAAVGIRQALSTVQSQSSVWRRRLAYGLLSITVLAGVLVGNHYRKRFHTHRSDFVRAGDVVQQNSTKEQLLVAAGGCCMSEPFYFSRRKGWWAPGWERSSDEETGRTWLEERKRQGATIGVVTSTYGDRPATVACTDAVAWEMVSGYQWLSESENHIVVDLRRPIEPKREFPCK